MKRYLIPILAILVLASGLLVGCSKNTATYHNSTYGYYIDYPSDWTPSQLSGDEMALKPPDSPAGLVISRLHKLPAGESISEYSSAYLKYLSQEHDDFQLVSLRQLSDLDYQLDYERGDTRYRDYIMLRDGWVYMITCLCSQPALVNHNYTFHQIYFSFRFTPTSHTNKETEATDESPTLEEWGALNRWLSECYGLPPVKNTEQLQSAAFLVSSLWFEEADKAVKKLEQHAIPWERTSPFFYLFNYYILHDIQLRNASRPIEFMAIDHLVVQSVKDLHDAADELVLMKELGEPLNVFPTEEDAMKWFREFDKDYQRLLEEAVNRSGD